MVVRNTQPNLDLIEAFINEVSQWELRYGSTTKSGIIPLELDLPSAGQVLRFTGEQGPEVLELRYVSWERQMAWACGMMAAGGLLFAWWGRLRAVLRTLLLAVVLSLAVKLLAAHWLPLANAALFGWLAALVLWLVFRFCAWIARGIRETEPDEAGKEVAA